MNRPALEHILRAASAVADVRDIVVIGSQAILGQFPDAPDSLLASVEADVYPRDAPERSDLIDGAIGELSMFHQTFGYYAHGVDESTAVLPEGWKSRLVRVDNENTGGAVGWCLDAHDLAVAKLVAGRDRDARFVRVLLAHGMVDGERLRERLDTTAVADARRNAAHGLLNRLKDQ